MNWLLYACVESHHCTLLKTNIIGWGSKWKVWIYMPHATLIWQCSTTTNMQFNFSFKDYIKIHVLSSPF